MLQGIRIGNRSFNQVDSRSHQVLRIGGAAVQCDYLPIFRQEVFDEVATHKSSAAGHKGKSHEILQSTSSPQWTLWAETA
jgi:hypothetical protein